MSREVVVKIIDTIGTGFCLASSDGELVYQEIAMNLNAGNKVVLSFEGTKDLITAFLHTAIGQLYNKEFDYDFIKQHIKIDHADQDQLHKIKRVVERAKEFYSNPERLERAANEVL